MRNRYRRLLLVVTALLGAAAGGATQALAQTITEFLVGAAPFDLSSINAGPDGALWFTDASAGSYIGRIPTSATTANPQITLFPLPTPYCDPESITPGPDGALWFAEYGANNIGRITTAGVLTEFPIPTGQSYPSSIAAGPDGALWFTELAASKIGRITTAGVITEFSTSAGSYPSVITMGPDGALWFTESISGELGGGSKIGRITTAGAITEFPISIANSGLSGITTGPDGALWFLESGGIPTDHVGRMTTAGVITEFTIPTANAGPQVITTGPDGALWFTENALGGQDRPQHHGRCDYRIPDSHSLQHARCRWHHDRAGRRAVVHRPKFRPDRASVLAACPTSSHCDQRRGGWESRRSLRPFIVPISTQHNLRQRQLFNFGCSELADPFCNLGHCDYRNDRDLYDECERQQSCPQHV
jgi:virginiamycin B lyase